MSTIAIFGGTGYTGSAIRDEALARGHRVIVVSRTGGSGVPEAVQAREGSVHDAELVEELAATADALVVAIHWREGASGEGRRLVEALPALTTAAAAHGARLGVAGGSGSLLVAEGGARLMDTPEFPPPFRVEAGAAAEGLEWLRADTSGADWFYLSPPRVYGAFSPSEATGSYRLGDDVLVVDDDGLATISSADLALAFVDELDTPAHHRARFTVAH